MGLNHDLFSSGAVTFKTTASGTFINETAGGTGAPAYAGNHDYHAAVFVGTMANVGTLFVYGHTAPTGDGTTALGSIAFGSNNGAVAAFDFRTDVLTGLGTAYAYWSAQVKVQSGGTFAGALLLVDYNARSSGTSPAAVGVGALGTLYS